MYLFSHTFCYHYILFPLTFKLTLSPYPIFPKVYNVSSLCYMFNLFSCNFTLLSYLTIDQKYIVLKQFELQILLLLEGPLLK